MGSLEHAVAGSKRRVENATGFISRPILVGSIFVPSVMVSTVTFDRHELLVPRVLVSN